MLDDYFLCTRLARQLMKLVTKRGSRTLAVLCLLGFTGSAGAPWQQQSTKANLQLVNTVPQSYDAQENFGAVHWIEGSYGWVISGPKDKDKLKAVASAAYDQLEKRIPSPSQGAAGQLISRRGS